MTALDTSAIRAQFPALRRMQAGQPVAWFDGPGGASSYPRYKSSNGLMSRGSIERVGPGNIPQDNYRNAWDG